MALESSADLKMGPIAPDVAGVISVGIGCWFKCGWKETGLVVLRILSFCSRMLFGVHKASTSAHGIEADDLELHEGGSKEVVDLITDLH